MSDKGILSVVGNTPLVQCQVMLKHKPNVKILFKLEGNNPGGSVKDRAALNMITEAMKRGDVTKDTRLIEATSGNTGIALAMVAQVLGLTMELVMPDTATKERRQTMQAYGAIVTLVSGGIIAARRYAEEKVNSGEGYYMLNQFANDDNWGAHYKTTGPEIWRDTDGKVTHFVSAMGTTGTIMGTSRFLKEQNSNITIVGCQPTDGSSIPGIRKWPEEFLPKIFDRKRVDQVIEVSTAEATAMTKRMAKEEGILAGMSSGGCAYAALKLAETLEEGLIVCIVCDRGDRYLSSNLFA